MISAHKLLLLFCYIPFVGISQSYTVSEVKGNSAFNEFAPRLYKNYLVFVSDRKWDLLKEVVVEDNSRMTNLYTLDNDGKPILFDENIVSEFNEGPVSYSRSEDTMYITRNQILDLKSSKKKKNTLGIFRSIKTNGVWSTPEPTEINDISFSNGHPFIDPKGKYLLFSSDRPSGFGGSDLYISEIKNGKCMPPLNLGSGINTASNESYPATNALGQMLFTSDRPGGLGGLDIYISYNRSDGTWGVPVTLAEPVNSAYDDFSCTINAEGNMGYFASNRKGSDDIFKFKLIPPVFETCEEMKKVKLCYKLSELTNGMIDTLPVKLKWSFGDNTAAYGQVVKHCYKSKGDYNINLDLEDTITKQTFMNVASYELKIGKPDVPYITSPDTIFAGDKVLFSSEETDFVAYDLVDVYWNMGDEKTSKGLQTIHTFSRAGKYDVTLGLIVKNKFSGEHERICAFKKLVVLNRKASSPDQKNVPEESELFVFDFSRAIPNSLVKEAIAEMVRKKQQEKELYLTASADLSYSAYDRYNRMKNNGLTYENVAIDYQYLHLDSNLVNRVESKDVFKLYTDLFDNQDIHQHVEALFKTGSNKMSGKDKLALSKSFDGIKLSECFLVIEVYPEKGKIEKFLLDRAKTIKSVLLKQGADNAKIVVFSKGEGFAKVKTGNHTLEKENYKAIITVIQKK